MEGGHGFPDLGKFAGPAAGVVNLASEGEVGFAVDEKGVAAVLLDEARSIFSERGCACGECEQSGGGKKVQVGAKGGTNVEWGA